MTEQGVNRLRRRADARAFDRACDAALKIGARRILSVAYERAIEGTVKRHHFHGELKAEERIYDNRLLVALVNKLPSDLLAPTPDTEQVAANWEPWMEAIEQGRDAPPPPPAPPPPAPEPLEGQVWKEECGLVTNCPPPSGFDDFEDGEPGERFYLRRLTAAEEHWWEEEGEELAVADTSWGTTFHYLDRQTFFPWGPEPLETLDPAEAAEPEGEASEAHEPSAVNRPGADAGVAGAERGNLNAR